MPFISSNFFILLRRLVSQKIRIFLDNAVVGAGIESLMELAQLPTMIQTLITIKCVKIGVKSERELEKLDEATSISW